MTVPPRIRRQRRRRIALRLVTLFGVVASISGAAGWASRSTPFVIYRVVPWCSTGWRDPGPDDAKRHGIGLTSMTFMVFGGGAMIVTVPEPYREVTLHANDTLELVCDGNVAEKCRESFGWFASPVRCA